MNDMSATIIAKSDQINAADLVGGPISATIREVRIKAGEDQPVSIFFEGYDKAFRPCKGVRRLLVNAWGADASKYIGCSLTLFRDSSVTWAGKEEGGIRVSHMSHIDKEFVEWMRTSRAATRPYKILPLKLDQPNDPKTDPAAKWARAFIGKVSGAADRVELEKLVEDQAARLAELSEKRPELHSECAATIEDARGRFAPEGRADDQHGDQHDGTEWPGE